jgi:hypothetical protein
LPFQGVLHHSSELFSAASADYLAFPNGVYAADFAQGTAKKLFTPTPGDTVRSAHRWKVEHPKTTLAVVFTHKTINVMKETGEPVFSAPWTHERENYEIARFGRLENPQRYVIWYKPAPSLRRQDPETMASYLIEFNPAGQETACLTVPPVPAAEVSYARMVFGVATPVVEVTSLVGAIRYGGSNAQPVTNPLLRFLADVTESLVPGGSWTLGTGEGPVLAFEILTLLSAATCALVCFLLARRHAFSRARCICWAVCGFLFGPVGVLLMLALQEWPARVICPKCRKPRVVTLDNCEHCGAPHAPPTPDGTEIFEPFAARPHPALVER